VDVVKRDQEPLLNPPRIEVRSLAEHARSGTSPCLNKNQLGMRYTYVLMLTLVAACASARRYYLHAELPHLEGNPQLVVAPGPWPDVFAVISDMPNVPDDLVAPHALGIDGRATCSNRIASRCPR
jgi:hypothetical protein